jgi:hypothetical protein
MECAWSPPPLNFSHQKCATGELPLFSKKHNTTKQNKTQ